MATIGVLSSEPQEYAVRPILFSGTCKMEMSEQHAKLVRTVLEACHAQSRRNNLTYHTVSVASDGEAKRGDVLVILTMTSQLSEGSPIYAQLQPLQFMNQLVGPDNITADKDFKHVIKHQRNIFMRNKGVEIQGFCYRRHLHQPRGQLGAWVSRGNRPQKETSASVSMYPLMLLTSLVVVIVCRPRPPSPPPNDLPMMSTYICVFWTLVFLPV